MSAVTALLFAFASFGCAERCVDNDSNSGRSPKIYVIDSRTHEPICQADVEIRDGDYAEVAVRPSAACTGFYSVTYRAGRYTVSVSADGYQPGSAVMRVYKDECGLMTTVPDGPRNGLPGYASAVTVALEPEA